MFIKLGSSIFRGCVHCLASAVPLITVGLLATSLSASVLGCGGEGKDGVQSVQPAHPDRDLSLRSGAYVLTVSHVDLSMSLRRGDEVLLDLPPDGIQLGAVDELKEKFNYDPYSILGPKNALSKVPQGLRWLSVRGATVESVEDGAFRLEMVFDENKVATLEVAVQGNGRFELKITASAEGVPTPFYRLRHRVDTHEGLYGLGEYFDDVNNRGHVRAMQMEIAKDNFSHYNQAHVPIPLLVGTRGWGLFVQSRYPGAFDVASRQDDRVDVQFGLGTDYGKGLTFYWLAADHPEKITKQYYELTGYPKLPAPWALGPWVWRDENKDQAQVEDDLNTIRKLDLPTSGYWIDRPYATAVNTFDFDPEMFDDPHGMIERAHDLGFRMALWHVPYLDDKSDATASLRKIAKDRGFYPPVIGAVVTWGPLMDLTNPEAFSWWQGNIRRYTDMGIEGFKLDYAEDLVTGLLGGRNIWRFHDGSDERTMHATYQELYHRVYAQTLPQDGGFLLCRASTYGDQTQGIIIWPGDIDANLAHFGEETTDRSSGEKYLAVGGVPAAVTASLSLGVSGFPFFGSDTGGYTHAPPDKETFVRWFEHTALSSVMQIGTNTNDVAWEFRKDNGFDEQMLTWYRQYTRLHIRLFAYEWTYAHRIRTTGLPIQRALGLAYPELGVHPSDAYLFGDNLFVAPVVNRGQRERVTMLPPGAWVDWWTGRRFEGAQEQTLAAPLETLPLLLKEGALVPLLRPTVDTLAPTTKPQLVDSYANDPGVLYVRTSRGPYSSFELFDGTQLKQQTSGAEVVLSYDGGDVFDDGAVFEVIGEPDEPVVVTMDGHAVARTQGDLEPDELTSGWSYEPDLRGGLVRVRVPSGEHEVRLHVQ